MLVIRSAQMHVLGTALRDAYIDECTAYAASTWSACRAGYPDAIAFRSFVDDCVTQAQRLGFRERDHTRRMLDWQCEFGAGFWDRPEHAWVLSILNIHLNEASKIHRLERRLQLLRERTDT